MHSRLLFGWLFLGRLLFGWLMLGPLSLHALMPSSYVYKAPFSSFPHFPNQVPPLTQQLGTPPVLHLGHAGIGLVGAGFFVGLLLTGGLLTAGLLTAGFGGGCTAGGWFANFCAGINCT